MGVIGKKARDLKKRRQALFVNLLKVYLPLLQTNS